MTIHSRVGNSMHAPWSLRRTVRDLRDGRTTLDQVWDHAAARYEEVEAQLTCWVEFNPTRPVGPFGQLGGVPIGVKDIIDVAGFPTRCGTALREQSPPAERDAAIVNRWREAGAAPIGKTVTTEFAYFAPGPTRNPVDPMRTPGGSSSGSAAAVAAGVVPLALGSQTAGSLIRPASYCGVAGLVMSPGRFENEGVAGLSHSLDSHGLLAASVGDLFFAWQSMFAQLGRRVDTPPTRDIRLVAWSGSDVAKVDQEMTHSTASSLDRLDRLGISVHQYDFGPLISDLAQAHKVVMGYEVARAKGLPSMAHERTLSPQLLDLIAAGWATTVVDYRDARRLLRDAGMVMARLFQRFDAIVGPGATGVAPLGLEATGDPVLSRPWQVLGLPVVAVAGAQSSTGLPLGMQVIGPRRGETRTMAVAERVERAMQAQPSLLRSAKRAPRRQS